MKFLIIAPRFHTNLYYRTLALKNAGHEIKVLVMYKGKSEFYGDFDIQLLKFAWLSRILLSIVGLFKKNYLKSGLELRLQWPGNELKTNLRNFKPDAILLKAYQDMLAIKSLYLARRQKIKVLMFTQTTFTHIKGSQFLFKLNVLWFKRLKVLAYITPIEQNYIAFRKVGIQNVYYLPFVYPNSENTIIYENKALINILSIGKFVKRKDHLLLVKAIERIKTDYNVKLTIIGERADLPCYQEVKDYISKNSLESNVSILAHLSYTEIQKQYARHQLFVLAAYNEPAAYSPVEAMAHGLPVILSTDSGTNCYIQNGINGFIFEAGNLDDLTSTIKASIESSEKLLRMSAAANHTAQNKHHLKGFSDAIMKIINN